MRVQTCLLAGASVLMGLTVPAYTATLAASYYSLGVNDPDVANSQPAGSLVSTVGAGLGVNGLPILTATGQGSLHDFNVTTKELEWWSPALYAGVTALNNPVYPSSITLPFVDNSMYTNTTTLGANGDDNNAFLTAKFVGNFTLAGASNISFNVCSDDDEFVYLSGGVFGAGTLVVDNGGIHATSCSGGNVNTSLLNNAAAGTYTLTVFYADRQHSGAVFQLDSALDLVPPPTNTTPEPGAAFLLGSGLMALLAAGRKRLQR